MPVITPSALSRTKPAGRFPEATAHVYGGDPPEAERLARYPALSIASGRVDVAMVNPDEPVDPGGDETGPDGGEEEELFEVEPQETTKSEMTRHRGKIRFNGKLLF